MKVVKQGKRNSVSRFLRSKGDKDKIAVWRYDLIRILQVFNVRSPGSIGRSRVTAYPSHLDRAGHKYELNGCGYPS